MANQYVYKADQRTFNDILIEFLEENCTEIKEEGEHFQRYVLNTIHGTLEVLHPHVFNKPNERQRVLSVMSRFHDWSSLPSDANQHSGKWNFHINCPKGTAEESARNICKSITNILKE